MTDATRKDVLLLTADLTPAELAEALGALRFVARAAATTTFFPHFVGDALEDSCLMGI